MQLESAARSRLAEVARKEAALPFHGSVGSAESNIKPMIDLFPKWNAAEADRMWCAAFVYDCCVKTGFEIPYSPDECMTCSLAGCGGGQHWQFKYVRNHYEVAGCAYQGLYQHSGRFSILRSHTGR